MYLRFKESVLELKNVKNLCFLSLLIVLKIVVSSLRIVISPYIQISFGFLIYIVVGCLFGIFCSVILAILSYILSFFVGFSNFFHVGFLVSSIFSAFIYSVFLYKKKFSYKRVVFATIVNDILVHFFLNIIWLSQLFYGGNFVNAFILRVPKNFVMLPIDCVLSFFVLAFVRKLLRY